MSPEVTVSLRSRGEVGEPYCRVVEADEVAGDLEDKTVCRYVYDAFMDDPVR